MDTEYFIISMMIDDSPPVYVVRYDSIIDFTRHKSEALILSDTAPFYEVLMTYNATGRTIAMLSVEMPDIEEMLST